MKKTEENCNKKDEITGLLAQIVDLQKKSKTVSINILSLNNFKKIVVDVWVKPD